MTALSIRLPESLHAAARQLAAEEGVSINHLVTLALAEKISALKTEDYLGQRAARADRSRYQAALSAVRARQQPAAPGDEI